MRYIEESYNFRVGLGTSKISGQFFRNTGMKKILFQAKNLALSVCTNISVNKHQIEIHLKETHHDQE
jgi:hypothetical protein